jgi:alanine racemase
MAQPVPLTPRSPRKDCDHKVMTTGPYRSWVEISRPQIAANYQSVCKLVGPSIEVMPVVKADAYRHGAVEVSRTLMAEGARWLAVSNVEEGVALREAGINARILVMADFLPAGRLAMVEHGLTPVLHSLEDVAELDALARTVEQRVSYHLKIDSGMGRLGTRAPASEIVQAIRAATAIDLEGLMTHFASVTDFRSRQTEEQTALFYEVADALRQSGIEPPYIHLSSTGALAYGRREAWGNLVRPGHCIYGYTSPARGGNAPACELDVKPALSWKASILTIKEVAADSLIGYGGIFRANAPMRIAVLAVGYADGLPHRLSNRGHVIAGGVQVPILGAVSMDVTTIDVTPCPQLKPGDAVTILGEEGGVSIDAQEMARLAGTISYNVLCAISSRVKRVYL